LPKRLGFLPGEPITRRQNGTYKYALTPDNATTTFGAVTHQETSFLPNVHLYNAGLHCQKDTNDEHAKGLGHIQLQPPTPNRLLSLFSPWSKLNHLYQLAP
jgi:hypothetical protein